MLTHDLGWQEAPRGSSPACRHNPAGRTGAPGPNPSTLRGQLEHGKAQLRPERGHRPSETPRVGAATAANPPHPRATTHKRELLPPLSYLRAPTTNQRQGRG